MDPVPILRQASAIALIDLGACDVLHICRAEQGPLYSPRPATDDPWGMSKRGVKRETAMRQKRVLLAAAVLATAMLFNGGTSAQTTPTENAASNPDNAIMITVFLKHDQSRPVDELNAQLEKQGYYKSFPPPGIEVVSWYVMMGIGQVITLRLPASRLREVNRIFETTAWGPYRTEFYPTYDFKPTGIAKHEKAQ